MARRKEEEKILDVNAAMQGSLTFSDPVNLRINGKFDGSLTTKGSLIIGEDALVNAEILGEDIIVAGKVKGKIKAIKGLQLAPTARVDADVEVANITVEGGAIFNGRCKMWEEKISLPELADYLSVEESKITEWVQNGGILAEKESGKLYFDRREVETWISANR